MNKTSIQWTWAQNPDGTLVPMSGSTWNPLLGCKEVSPGCRNCYAARLIGVRFSKNPKLPMYHGIATTAEANRHPRFTGARRLVPDRLDEPLRARKGRKVFVCDMGDLFFEGHPFEDIAAVFGVMAAARQHTFQVLTKRPERVAEFFAWIGSYPSAPGTGPGAMVHPFAVCTRAAQKLLPSRRELSAEANYAKRPRGGSLPWPLPNVWIGTSVEDRDALHRVDALRTILAPVRFLSIEPSIEDLGTVDLTGIAWAIVGGESGPHARPFDLAWMRSLRDQCRAAGVAFFPKQVGAHPYVEVHGVMTERIRPPGIRDSHGGDETEWPTDLRGLRAFPAPAPGPRP